jgi:hypothetical protein
MSKTKTLFTMVLLVLLGSMGAAQAQDFAEVNLYATPTPAAREGGKSEAAGDVFLTFSDDAANEAVMGATVTLHFSVPLAEDSMVSTNDGADGGVYTSGITTSTQTDEGVSLDPDNSDNDDNGTITIIGFTGAGETSLLIRGVRLDVSDASGPVTVMMEVETGSDDFIRIDGSSVATVVSEIKLGVTTEATAGTVRTRGTSSTGIMATLTIEEGFDGAFMNDDDLEIEVRGIPNGATVTISAPDFATGDPAATGGPPVPVEDDPSVMVDGSPLTGETGENETATLMLGGAMLDPQRTAPDKFDLTLTLTADPDGDMDDLSFPLDVGSITVRVTFKETDTDFDEAFTASMAVFNIRPAQCTMLFPVVTVMPMADGSYWNTAISITNPGYGEETADGGLTLTFYGVGIEPVEYMTSPTTPGTGLEADGTLAAGGTYQVMVSQILAESGWGETFQGHVHVTADYTGCTGLGWVTDFATVNQAYLAVVIDDDTGK